MTVSFFPIDDDEIDTDDILISFPPPPHQKYVDAMPPIYYECACSIEVLRIATQLIIIRTQLTAQRA